MSVCFDSLYSVFAEGLSGKEMDAKEYSNPNRAKPHRCAYLFDDILDAMHPWNKENIKMAYGALRTCMKNKNINADHIQKPRYVQPKENYEGMM